MQVDVVRHLTRRVIAEVKLDEIALAHADETARNVTAKRPEKIIHSIRHLFHLLDDLQSDDELRRMLAGDRRRHQRWAGEHRLFLADDFGVGTFCRRTSRGGCFFGVADRKNAGDA